jgi:hypothetical protein
MLKIALPVKSDVLSSAEAQRRVVLPLNLTGANNASFATKSAIREKYPGNQQRDVRDVWIQIS